MKPITVKYNNEDIFTKVCYTYASLLCIKQNITEGLKTSIAF